MPGRDSTPTYTVILNERYSHLRFAFRFLDDAFTICAKRLERSIPLRGEQLVSAYCFGVFGFRLTPCY